MFRKFKQKFNNIYYLFRINVTEIKLYTFDISILNEGAFSAFQRSKDFHANLIKMICIENGNFKRNIMLHFIMVTKFSTLKKCTYKNPFLSQIKCEI